MKSRPKRFVVTAIILASLAGAAALSAGGFAIANRVALDALETDYNRYKVSTAAALEALDETFLRSQDDLSFFEERLDNLTQQTRAHQHASDAHFLLLDLVQNVPLLSLTFHYITYIESQSCFVGAVWGPQSHS